MKSFKKFENFNSIARMSLKTGKNWSPIHKQLRITFIQRGQYLGISLQTNPAATDTTKWFMGGMFVTGASIRKCKDLSYTKVLLNLNNWNLGDKG